MKRSTLFLLTILQSCWINTALAHRPSEIHTSIQLNDNQIIVQFDFPWTLQKALVQYFPDVEKEKLSDVVMLNYLKNYIEQNFSISANAEVYAIESIRLIPNDHNHSIKCELTYPASKTANLEIENRLFFEISERQKNYHSISWYNQKKQNFITKASAPQFVFKAETNIVPLHSFFSFWQILLICFTILPGVFMIIYQLWFRERNCIWG